ncbi:Nuclear membrane fusion protein Kar5 [Rasamsonia emersonii CBS 393.64]|uniref:Nuclear membrane fusion protein Kar5 n=1 Tax=Rasamsonia emersonii (strain ATCC 16479 / CBS 393.64 / IMI 116815) TaxID=1408163 RepID=A0A0F4YTE1_RASE3|nr:Nuclear membrane fusion protein Kar5 [Rasamsonia emersonii CBS 393.64]KKA21557.1 Nuclear membrane fusion protein Kar5 [Rasamsonia emersonii CBS 393.64]
MSAENFDLVEFLNARTLQRDSVFSEAIQLLESMKSSPSCNRIAATKLLTSCQTLGDHANAPASDVPMTLDRVKSLYAARLAICELTGAGTAIPAACSPLHVVSEKTRNGGRSANMDILEPDPIPSTVLDACLKSLESRPQWWTSYSNSRQNAIVICQAARSEVEKEDMLKLHRSLAEHTAKLNKGLQEALRNAATDSAQHRAFVEATEVMRAELLRELEKSTVRARGIFSGLLNEIETVIGSSVAKVMSAIKDVEADSTALGEGIRASSNDVEQLQHRLREMHEEAMSRNAKFAETQQREAKINQELAVAMRLSLDALVTQDMARLSERVVGVDGALEWFAERFSLIHQQEHLILERLQSFESALDESGSKAKELLETQTLQAKALATQSEVQEALGASAKVAQALLDQLTAKAANLETVLEDTAVRFNDLPVLSGILGIKLSPWTLCSLLFAIIAVQNPKAAVLVVFCGGKFNHCFQSCYNSADSNSQH